jgi:hypothetical protein
MRRALILQCLIGIASLLPQSVVRADFISYLNPAKINGKDAVGNQGYAGSIGMDFRTLDPISITQLGVFDSGLKGIAAGQTLTVAIFDTTTGKEVTPEVTFTNKDPGKLVEGSLFKTLKTPVKFDAGADLSVVAWGFSNAQMNGNFYLAPFNGKGNPPWTTNGNGDTNGWIGYTGTGRFIDKPGVFPTNVDMHKPGVPNPYAAGTFMWIEGPFGTPEPSSFVLMSIGTLCLVVVHSSRKFRRATR